MGELTACLQPAHLQEGKSPHKTQYTNNKHAQIILCTGHYYINAER